MLFTWDESMSTGVPELDEAHRRLFECVNELGTAIKEGTGHAGAMRTLDFLGTYAAQHFGSEEDCMHRHQCPAALTNKKAHTEFLAYFTRMKADCESSGFTNTRLMEMQQALGNWLRNHIMKIDVTLKPCIK